MLSTVTRYRRRSDVVLAAVPACRISSQAGGGVSPLVASKDCYSRRIAREWVLRMDAKSLQKHKRLKMAAESSDEKGTAAPHVPGQGFSEESEKFFASIAAKKRDELAIPVLQEAASEPYSITKPDHELDKVTLELRIEFALLNRIFELREIALDRSKKKLNRKAAKAAIRAAKQAAKELKPKKPIKQPKRTKPSTQEPASEWVQKACWRCNSKFSIRANWERPPSLCKACAKDLDETHLPSGPDRSTPFTSVHFVSGGAPGLGKRR